jgi:hypothetical protein
LTCVGVEHLSQPHRGALIGMSNCVKPKAYEASKSFDIKFQEGDLRSIHKSALGDFDIKLTTFRFFKGFS